MKIRRVHPIALAIWLILGTPASSQSGADFSSLYQQALQLYRSGKHAEATPIAERAVAVAEQSGAEHRDVAFALNFLGLLYAAQGRYADAEPAYKRALAVREKIFGLEHPSVGTSLNNLAELHRLQGRLAEAEPLYKRDLAILEKAVGREHQDVGTSLNNLGLLFQAQQRFADAEASFTRALAIKEKALGPDHAEIASLLNNLGELHRHHSRFAHAGPLHERALAIKEKTLHREHPSISISLNNLALTYHEQGRHPDATALYKRALALAESTLGESDPNLALTLINLGGLHLEGGKVREAIQLLERGAEMILRRSKRDADRIGRAQAGGSERESALARLAYTLLTKAMHQSIGDEPQRSDLIQKTFVLAQLAQSSVAARSVAQMSARTAKGNAALAGLVRERQDLVSEWYARDKLLVAALSLPPGRRNPQAEQEIRSRLIATDTRIAHIDRELASAFPEYAALVGQEPMSVQEVQANLGTDEALVMILVAPTWKRIAEDTFVWVVTKSDVRWVRSDLGNQSLDARVAVLRCGLDQAAWVGDGAGRCAVATGTTVSGGQLPFDLTRAYELYEALFGPVLDLIKAKQLLIVPSGPLRALPLQVLVTERPPATTTKGASDYSHAAWLARRHALTVLPSVASLQSLRRFAKASAATQPFVGFGNPLLHGPEGTDRSAWERQNCEAPTTTAQAGSRSRRSPMLRRDFASVDDVRAQHPLPDTADELCAVAGSMGAGADTVFLGEKATETTIKGMSMSGALANWRVVHFATHGLLPGETEMLGASRAEPALLLTPPDKASADDDGLLTASEIAQLKLDADWVVLSACNTAAGDAGSEALSGLARAFFYAGARTVLASHWAVNSDATVQLITKAFAELKADANIGRAEALRRSMLSLIELSGGYAHPANWAPFVVVGEGAR